MTQNNDHAVRLEGQTSAASVFVTYTESKKAMALLIY